MNLQKFIPISQVAITELEVEYVTDAVRSTWISSLGKYIDEFEREFANFCGVNYAVTASNGTVAMHLVLRALGIKAGDEVIVPNLSFIATANSVLYMGATPVFADVDPYNLCIDPKDILRCITPRTRAIIPVHLYGHPADMETIMKIAQDHNLLVMEDAAEAHGATIRGKKVGSWGHCATFSFYGNKNITTGEGGMITTQDKDLYNKMRFLRDHAMSKEKRYWHTELGYNYRITNLQAALGCAQMKRIDQILHDRRQIYEWYSKYMPKHPKLHLNRTYEWATNAYWLITLEIDGYDESQRDRLIMQLREHNIDSRPFFYPMSDMPYIGAEVMTPMTHAIYQRGINLPTFIGLKEEEVAYIGQTISKLLL